MDVTITQTVKRSEHYFATYRVHVVVMLDERERSLYETYGAFALLGVLSRLHPTNSDVVVEARARDVFQGGYTYESGDVFKSMQAGSDIAAALKETALRWKQAQAFAGTRELHIDTSEAQESV